MLTDLELALLNKVEALEAELNGLSSKRAEMNRKAAEGRERAKKKGKHLGRPSKVSANEVRTLRAKGYSLSETAKALNCSVATVSRLKTV